MDAISMTMEVLPAAMTQLVTVGFAALVCSLMCVWQPVISAALTGVLRVAVIVLVRPSELTLSTAEVMTAVTIFGLVVI